MLAQFSIWSLDNPHMSRDVAEVASLLDECGVRHEIGPMGTTVEGEWDNVLAAIKMCHEAVHDRHQRVLTTITIDDDTTRQQSIDATMAKVDEEAAVA